MRKIIGGLIVAALALAAGCSSSSSSAPKAVSGTEHIAGTLGGAAASSSKPVIHLAFTGPVDTSGSTNLGGAPPAHGTTHAFATAAGKLTVLVTNHPTSSVTPKVDTVTCAFVFPTNVAYAIDTAKSTGKWATTTGSGLITVEFKGTLPKLANGHCNTSRSATPIDAHLTFAGAGPATVKG